METFNPINYCENLLKNYEIVSLSSLEKAVSEVKQKIENEKESALISIKNTQKTISDKGGMNLAYSLLERQSKAYKDLEAARVLVKELNRDYEDTSKVLEEKEIQRKNGILLRDLVVELDHYNMNQTDIKIDPKHLVYLKFALETLDLTEFNTVIVN